MVVDGYSEEELVDILNTRIDYRRSVKRVRLNYLKPWEPCHRLGA